MIADAPDLTRMLLFMENVVNHEVAHRATTGTADCVVVWLEIELLAPALPPTPVLDDGLPLLAKLGDHSCVVIGEDLAARWTRCLGPSGFHFLEPDLEFPRPVPISHQMGFRILALAKPIHVGDLHVAVDLGVVGAHLPECLRERQDAETHLDDYLRTTDLGGDVRIRVSPHKDGRTRISIGQYRSGRRVERALRAIAARFNLAGSDRAG